MKIALLGATGPSGQLLLQQALDAGHHVVCLVRDPAKITQKSEQCTAEKVSIFDADSMAPHMQGCDAVLSCLGQNSGYPWNRVTIYSTSIKSIIDAMKTAAVSRLIVMSSWCSKKERGNPKSYEWFLKPLIVGRSLDDMGRMEDYILTQPEINYTSVRAGILQDKALDDREISAKEGQWVPKATNKIPRANVGKFMLSCLNTEEWDRKMVAISMPK